MKLADAYEAFLMACQEWDGTGNFRPYAHRRVHWRMIDLHRRAEGRNKDRPKMLSLNYRYAYPDGRMEETIKLLANGHEGTRFQQIEHDAKDELHDIITKSGPKTRAALRLLAKGFTAREVGTMLDVSEAAIHLWLREVKARVRSPESRWGHYRG